MTDSEKKIIETFAFIIPRLSENDKSYLLGLGEGMAIKVGEEIRASEKIMEGQKAKMEAAV